MVRRKRYRWSANLAYAIGLIATDGSLSKDGRHIDLTSKDLEQLQNFAKILSLNNKISSKSSSYNPQGLYWHIAFGNVIFYRFLLKIGLTPAKSKTIGAILIPDKYFADFLRGSLDGDGYTYSYWDPRWRSSFSLYTGFVSASLKHLEWISDQVERLYELRGKIKFSARAYSLVYAKKASVALLNKIYYKKGLICLTRKSSKINIALSIISKA